MRGDSDIEMRRETEGQRAEFWWQRVIKKWRWVVLAVILIGIVAGVISAVIPKTEQCP